MYKDLLLFAFIYLVKIKCISLSYPTMSSVFFNINKIVSKIQYGLQEKRFPVDNFTILWNLLIINLTV